MRKRLTIGIPALAVTILALLLTVGCAPSRDARMAAIRQEYPQWSGEMTQKAAEGKIEIGMTKEQVYEALISQHVKEMHTPWDQHYWRYIDQPTYGMQEHVTERIVLLFFQFGRLQNIDTYVRRNFPIF